MLFRSSLPAIGLLACLLILPAQAYAQSESDYFPPTDEAAEQPELAQFREAVIAAAKANDKSRLLSYLDADVEQRVQDSIRGKYAQEGIWEEREALAGILRLGGKFVNDAIFVAPYTAAAAYSKPEGQRNMFIVTGVDVPVYASPGLDAPILARLTHVTVKAAQDILAIEEKYGVELDTEGRMWVAVELSGGKTGFMQKDTVMHAERPLVQFEKKKGKWLITIVDVMRL